MHQCIRCTALFGAIWRVTMCLIHWETRYLLYDLCSFKKWHTKLENNFKVVIHIPYCTFRYWAFDHNFQFSFTHSVQSVQLQQSLWTFNHHRRHKSPNPLTRITVNSCNTVAYKLAKYVSNLFKEFVQLPSSCTINNTLNTINDLNEIKYSPEIKLCSHNTKNMYANIPTPELNGVLNNTVTHYNLTPCKLKQEITYRNHPQ